LDPPDRQAPSGPQDPRGNWGRPAQPEAWALRVKSVRKDPQDPLAVPQARRASQVPQVPQVLKALLDRQEA